MGCGSGKRRGAVLNRDGAPFRSQAPLPNGRYPSWNRFPAGGPSLSAKPNRFVVALELLALAAAAVVCVVGEANWDFALFTALLVFSVVSDVTADRKSVV